MVVADEWIIQEVLTKSRAAILVSYTFLLFQTGLGLATKGAMEGSGRYRFRALSAEITTLHVIVEDMG